MIFGQSEVWLRLPAVIFGIGSVALLYIVAKKLFGHRIAMLAALFMAISPLHINHSQEIRMYSLVTLVVVLEVFFFIRYAESGRLRDMLATLALAATAFLVFPLTIMMLLAFNLYVLLHAKSYKHALIPFFSGQFVLALASLPFISKLQSTLASFDDSWNWRIQLPGIKQMLEMTRDFNLWRIPEDSGHAVLAANIYGLFVLAVIIFGIAHMARKAGHQTAFVAIWLAAPLSAALIASHVVTNVWITRYLIYASPAYYILTGMGLAAMQNKRLYIIAVLAVISLPLVRLYTYYESPKRPEWREAVAYVENRLTEEDGIAIYRAGNEPTFAYYYTGSAPWVALGTHGLRRDAFENWSPQRVAELMTDLPASKRIWFILSYHEDTGGFSVENYINSEFKVLDVRDFNRIKIYLADRIIYPE